MFINNTVEQENADLDMFDITINFEDQKSISDKKKRSQRLKNATSLSN